MLDISIVNETSPEANWNRQADGQDHVLSQADALTKKSVWNILIYVTVILQKPQSCFES